MANRAGRLLKEAQILHVRAQEQEALRRAKNRQLTCRADAMAKVVASRHNMPRAMRRKSVRTGMLTNPMLLLTLALYCDRPHRLSTLRNWQPPRSCDHGVLYKSFRRQVLALAPLKDHQLQRLKVLVQNDNPSVAAWLVQTATDPEVTSELPMPVAKLFAEMNGKLYSGSMKYELQFALRHAQVLLLGATTDLADRVALVLPAYTSKHEAYFLQGIQFLIRHHGKISIQYVRDILLFMLNPLTMIEEHMRLIVEERLGRPKLNFGVYEPAEVLLQMSQWHEQLAVIKRDILIFPFPKTPLRDVYRGVGVFEKYTIHRLRHNAELVSEGIYMNHCVALFALACYYNMISIWSLTVEGRRVATIELKEHRQIVQFKGKNNCEVKGLPEAFMLKWAQTMGLKFVSC
ncbi:MAG: PcfJ domain-containing protein [Saprospiraceae bacterium]|nr:PcfJ domain-containing protein [Saprospiraceae bacterium]